jgi:hypothetical protein
MDLQNKNNFHPKHKRLLKSQKVESQKVESQKVESQKVDSQKVESQKVESQKVESQKVDSQKEKVFSIQKIKECNPNYNQFSVLSNY